MITTFQNTTFADVDGGVQIEHKVVNSRGGFKEARKSAGERKRMDKNSSNKTLYFFAICVVVNSLICV